MHIIDMTNHLDELEVLERAKYELAGRENVINFMVINGLKSHENYTYFWEEYLLYLKAYDILKEEFHNNFIRPQINFTNYRWEVDFEKKEVKVYEQ